MCVYVYVCMCGYHIEVTNFGVHPNQISGVGQALSGTDQAKYLESALSDAGFPISTAQLAKLKSAMEARHLGIKLGSTTWYLQKE